MVPIDGKFCEKDLTVISRRIIELVCYLIALPGVAHANVVVQVLGLSDSRQMPERESRRAGIQKSDNFCVVNTAGGAVELTFTNSGGAGSDGQSWLAKNLAGQGVAYRQFISNADGTATKLVSTASGDVKFIVDPKYVVTNSEKCNVGNVRKAVELVGDPMMKGGGLYRDIVSVKISPL
jgi:hypothetical protein